MRIRITFSKAGALRYIGHLDLHQVWERTARRASLPLAYTQGFHPGPRLQLASALPLGIIGQREIVDMWLTDDIFAAGRTPADWCALIQASAPPGLTVLSLEQVDERSPALQTQVIAANYEVTLSDPPFTLEQDVLGLMATGSLPRERRGKPYDLRPLILSLEVAQPGLCMQLSAREGATGRPEEVLGALGIPLEQTRIERTRLLFNNEIEYRYGFGNWR